MEKSASQVKGIELTRIVLENDDDKAELKNYLCKFCNLIPISPEICGRCGQLFCSGCMADYISDDNHNCPNCSVVYKKTDLPQRVIDFFEKMMIICQYESLGCEAVLDFSTISKHEKICKETFKECKNCLQNFAYKNFNNHIANCQNAIVKCEDCEYKDNKQNFDKTDKLMIHIQHKLMESVKMFFRDEMNNLKYELKTYIDERLTSVGTVGTAVVNPGNFNNYGNPNSSNQVQKIMFRQNICTNADNNYQLDNKFCVLKTFLGENLVVWGNTSYSLEAFDLEIGRVTHTVNKAHDSNIICLSHCLDPVKKLNYIISSSFDRSIKVWSVEEKWKNIINIPDAHTDYSIFSVQIFYNHLLNGLFIISSNMNEKAIKIWECEVKDDDSFLPVCQKIMQDVGGIKFVSIWFDSKSEEGKYYLLTANDKEVTSFEFLNNESYKGYKLDTATTFTSVVVNEKGWLINSDINGIIRVFDFHSGELVKTIIRSSAKIRISGICLWNENLLLAASNDKAILLFDLEEEKHTRSFTDHRSEVYCVKTFDNPMFGKSFFSYGFDSHIKLWY